VTSLSKERAGQAIGLNVFALFTGFGLGIMLFGELLRTGFPISLGVFGGFQFTFALGALFRFESGGSAA